MDISKEIRDTEVGKEQQDRGNMKVQMGNGGGNWGKRVGNTEMRGKGQNKTEDA